MLGYLFLCLSIFISWLYEFCSEKYCLQDSYTRCEDWLYVAPFNPDKGQAHKGPLSMDTLNGYQQVPYFF